MITKPPYYILITLLLVLCCSQTQNSRLNLSFEEIENGLPRGWKNNHYQGDYLVSLDSVNVKSGKYSVAIESKGDSSYVQALALELPHNYDGQRITLSGYIKTENIDNATLWVAIEPGIGFTTLPKNEIVGTTDWKKYEVSLDLNPMRTQKISIGGMLIGKGKMWIDDLKVTIDGRDISKAKPYEFKPYPAKEDREFDNGSKIEFPELSEQKIDDLELLGRIWGVLKYHHPEIARGNYNWDNELFRILPTYLNANNNKQRDEVLLKWIKKYGRISTPEISQTSDSVFQAPDLLWIERSAISDDLKNMLHKIYSNRSHGNNYYIWMRPQVGNPDFSNERTYEAMTCPDSGFRLLALYRYWNMINYFFPYRHLTDKDWNVVLREYIPHFIESNDRLSYELTVSLLLGEIGDSHAFLLGFEQLDHMRGDGQVPALVRFVENQLLVMEYYGENKKLERGDIITHIDGKPVMAIVDSIKKYFPSSNEAARMRDIADNILRSNKQHLHLNYLSSAEKRKEKEINVGRRDVWIYHRYRKTDTARCYKFINKDIGYITLKTIKEKDIPAIKETFKNTKGIVIDIRNYPPCNSITSLAPYFVSNTTPFVKFTVGNPDNPGEFSFRDSIMIQKSEDTYKGKLVVIVNAETQSSAEYHAMAFRAGDNTTIIGSQTAGADGNISEITLPGGLKTNISGIGVYYPNGKETQRIGIVPDIEVKPTIKGIREGRDELLEKAVQVILESE